MDLITINAVIAAIGVIILLAIFFHFVPFFLWLSAKVSGVKISLIQLFLMRIRNVPPGIIVPSLIEAHKAGLKTITRDNLEAHYMTGGHVQRVVHALVSASKANIDLPFEKATAIDVPFAENPSAVYAACRNALYQSGKKIEILVNYQPKLHYLNEWWKQLYGESEGKEGKGIFPAAVDFTTDLHSMGQWIQEGERTIFETVISIEEPNHKVLFPSDEENLDGLNFLAGKRVDEVNKMAELGTQLAHVDGGVPNMRLSVPVLNEYYLGQIIYFFEKACGISGNLLGVNTFNQPGVEAYKKNMFALLNKPGYEKESEAIRAKLNK